MLLWKFVTVIDLIKDSLAVALMVECSSTTTTPSTESILTSLLPWGRIVPWSIVTIISRFKVVVVRTIFELTMSAVEISGNSLVSLVGISKLSVRFSVIEISFLLLAFTQVSALLIRVTITDKMSLFIFAVLLLNLFATLKLVLKIMLATFLVMNGLLIISRTSVLQTIWPLLPFGWIIVMMSFTRSRTTNVVVEIFFVPFKFCHVLNRTNWHQVKFLEIILLYNISISHWITLELVSGISCRLRSNIVKLLDLLFQSEICSLKVLDELVLCLHD